MEMDCRLAVEMLNEDRDRLPSLILIRRTRATASHFDHVKFQFVNRERNKVANWIAKSFLGSVVNLCILDAPTFHVRRLLLEDKFGLPYDLII